MVPLLQHGKLRCKIVKEFFKMSFICFQPNGLEADVKQQVYK